MPERTHALESTATTRCPECRVPTDCRWPPQAAWPLPWRTLLPVVCVALAALIIGAWLFWTARVTKPDVEFSNATALDDPPFTFADVGRIASDGGEAGNPLCASIRRRMLAKTAEYRDRPGDIVIDVGGLRNQLSRRRSVMIGWPANWCVITEKRHYADAVARTGERPWTTDTTAETIPADAFYPGAERLAPQPRWSWIGGQHRLAYRAPVEETGGVKVNVDVFAMNIAASVALALLAVASTAMVVWIFNITWRQNRPPRGRWLTRFAALVVIAFMAVTACSTRHVKDEVSGYDMQGNEALAPTGGVYRAKGFRTGRLQTRGTDLAALIAADDGDRRLAREIMTAMGGRSDDRAYLGVDFTPEAMRTRGTETDYNHTIKVLTIRRFQFARRPDAGPHEFLAAPVGQSLSLNEGVLTWRSVSGDIKIPIVERSLNLQASGVIALELGVVWLMSRVPCVVAHRWMIRRRRRRGECLNCGYDLSHHVGPSQPVAGG